MRDEVEDIAYRMDALSSNSMKSANPHSGFHRIEVAPTLDTSDCNPLKNQGGGNDRMRTEIDNAMRRGGAGPMPDAPVQPPPLRCDNLRGGRQCV